MESIVVEVLSRVYIGNSVKCDDGSGRTIC